MNHADQTIAIPVVKDKWNEVVCHGEYPFDLGRLWGTVACIPKPVALKLLDDGILCNKAYRVISYDRWDKALAVYLHDFKYYLIETSKLEDASSRAYLDVQNVLNGN
jgi:hypothetical protein